MVAVAVAVIKMVDLAALLAVVVVKKHPLVLAALVL